MKQGAIAVLAAIGAISVARAEPSDVGAVAFENSGAPEAQAPFLRGLALLHNFEYDRAEAEFHKAQKIDPDFAIAYWGEAMTHNHPVWMEQDAGAARSALQRLGKTAKSRAAKARTERERAYLAAVETLFGEGKKEERDFAYEKAMANLHADYPSDVDAAAFYALSIIGTAHEGRDFAAYMRAAAELEEYFPDNPNHPGVLHYLIHSYDDPAHAPLGLRAARRYGDVAPDAAHALHMTSHIFVALGDWDKTIEMNERAIAVVNEQRKAAGKPEAFCGHYPSWLVYGYLQRDELSLARVFIDGCRALAEKAFQSRAAGDPDPGNSAAGSYFYMLSMLAADTGGWDVGDMPSLDNATDREKFSAAYAGLLRADADKDEDAISAASGELERLAPILRKNLDNAGNSSAADRAALEATRLQGEALLKLSRGDKTGIDTLKQAAAVEDAAPVEFGPPFVEKPSYELLADKLAALGRFEEAATAYRKALARAPGRARSVAGLAAAEKKLN